MIRCLIRHTSSIFFYTAYITSVTLKKCQVAISIQSLTNQSMYISIIIRAFIINREEYMGAQWYGISLVFNLIACERAQQTSETLIEHKKRNSISTNNCVLFCLSYKHHKPLLTKKVDLNNSSTQQSEVKGKWPSISWLVISKTQKKLS